MGDWNSKHYRARTKHRGVSYFIGWYPTKEEAEKAVRRFRQRKGWPTTPEQLLQARVNGNALAHELRRARD